MTNFNLNQIVKGAVCGTFVILGERTIDGEFGYQLKTVNPADHSQTYAGEMWLPANKLKPLN